MSQPNILLFLTDDHASWAARCYGNSELVTPNLETIKKWGQSYRASNFYSFTN
jgi:choline-sulfatase